MRPVVVINDNAAGAMLTIVPSLTHIWLELDDHLLLAPVVDKLGAGEQAQAWDIRAIVPVLEATLDVMPLEHQPQQSPTEIAEPLFDCFLMGAEQIVVTQIDVLQERIDVLRLRPVRQHTATTKSKAH